MVFPVPELVLDTLQAQERTLLQFDVPPLPEILLDVLPL
jgi:hypothetical protein